ncbi:DNA-3-methyladenine glycosylase I [Roseivirga sp. BDSF3-8]|uniref:DNA-3-methyladenine glycosylase I n=1 Tax=Roseivirga sp. BDSF3-8 TaxID=3241598 RepID=UPI003531EE1E
MTTLSKANRCPWAEGESEAYKAYHDDEWGVPVHDDGTHFEFLILEGAQAGLSWRTILHRREGYRRCFSDFDPVKVAEYTEEDIQRLKKDAGIIRNELKIRGAVTNARLFLKIQEEFGSFDKYIWGFVKGEPIINQWNSLKEVPARTEESDRLSKDLKKRGFKFTGSVIMYAHMQACGLVNDHLVSCFRYSEV